MIIADFQEQLITLIQSFPSFIPSLFQGLVVLLLGTVFASLVARTIRSVFKRRSMDPGLGGFLSSVVKTTILVVVWISALSSLGIQATSFVALVGAFGLAASLAFQTTLSNLAGGFVTLVFHPFKVGDFIELSGQMGTVLDITIMHTHVNTPDNRRLIIPNGQLSSAMVLNYSENPTRRRDLYFQAAYDNSIDQVKQILVDLLENHPMVLKDPEPIIGVHEHKDSAIEYLVRYHCKREDFLLSALSINEEVKKAFDAQQISIPFPQRDLRISASTLKIKTDKT